MWKKLVLLCFMASFLLLPSISASGATGTTLTKQVDSLPVVGSFANLKSLLEEACQHNPMANMGLRNAVTLDVAVEKQTLQAQTQAEYSATNVQVEGVDEADLVKTDGEYIYQINGQKVVIVKAYPAEEMEVVNTVNFGEEFQPKELYVDEDYLVVIGCEYRQKPYYESQEKLLLRIYPPYYPEVRTKACIYDLSVKSALKKVREIELEGEYLTSRKIGSSLYLIANKHIDYYRIMEEEIGNLTPAYRDSARGDNLIKIGYEKIRYFPDFLTPNYLFIAGLDLTKPQEEVNVSTYLGAGENVYASEKNLYIALTNYNRRVEAVPLDFKAASKINYSDPSTMVYKFSLEKGEADFQCQGEVPGQILNQFSMDEYGASFRIVTTKGEVWRTDEGTSQNNVYVLDASLQITGKLENIAPGEKVYSVRFMGERAYVVTFKKVDPLFVIDLKDPTNPQILGALKIPGYSDYLHPYDENHIIGFGKDTVEVSQKDWQGNEIDTVAYYQGMKIALFDVTNVEKPVEKFKVLIGDRGTESELLRNHKALLFSKEKNLLAFPVTVMERKDESQKAYEYGEFTFQGAYVYKLDLEKGFQLRGKITHLSADDYQKAGYGWYNSPKNVERIIYIGDTLYTLSRYMLVAHDLDSLHEINKIIFE